jgi:hypothetical protein
MDVNREGIMRECIYACLAVPGAFTVAELFNTEWPVYEMIIQTIIDVTKERAGNAR